MPVRDLHIERLFPLINSDYVLHSEQDHTYNCIAFAADDTTKFWWPVGYYWPLTVPRILNLPTFIECFKTLGYVECGTDETYIKGYEKVAIYTNPFGIPTHAAKQCTDKIDWWKSKLGPYKDILHRLHAISGNYHRNSYGHVAIIMRREIKTPSVSPKVI